MKERTSSIITTDIESYRFIHREKNQKDIEVYKKSVVDTDEYIFVQTIRLFAHEVKYMINEQNVMIFTSEWYRKFITGR